MDVTVTIPLWILLSFLLVCVVIGMLGMVLSTWLSYRGVQTRQHSVVDIAEVSPKASTRAPAIPPVAPTAAPAKSDALSAQANQRFWYYVKGHEKPIATLREVLALFPIEQAKYGKEKNLDYTAMPQYFKDSVRREPIERGKGK